MIYAGIGSRETPQEILNLMISIAGFFGNRDWILRSGGAKGADSAFEIGCDNVKGKKEIFLPTGIIPKEAFNIAEKYHSRFKYLNSYVKCLHARNCQIILGADLQLSCDMVFCYQDETKKFGGTRMGIKIAKEFNIEVLNLWYPHIVENIKKEIFNE